MPFNHEQEVKSFNLIKDARFDSREITYAEKQKEVCKIVKNTFKKELVEWLEGTSRYTKVVEYWESHEKCAESFFSEIIEKEKALKNYKEPKKLYHFLIKCFSNYLKRETRRINNECDKYGTISLDSYSGYSDEVNKIEISTLMVDDDPQAAVLKNELLNIIKEMLEKQSHTAKRIFKSYWFEELTWNEIAKILKISKRHAERLESPVREKLKEILLKYFPNVEPEILGKVSMKDIVDRLKTLGLDIIE